MHAQQTLTTQSTRFAQRFFHSRLRTRFFVFRLRNCGLAQHPCRERRLGLSDRETATSLRGYACEASKPQWERKETRRTDIVRRHRRRRAFLVGKTHKETAQLQNNHPRHPRWGRRLRRRRARDKAKALAEQRPGREIVLHRHPRFLVDVG